MLSCLTILASVATARSDDTGCVEVASTSSSEEVTIEMLLDAGYTQEGAENLLELDRILKKAESFGQVIDYIDGEWIITPSSSDGLNHVTETERDFVIKVLSPYVTQVSSRSFTKSREQAYAELNQSIRENPDAKSHLIDMGNGRYLKCTTSIVDSEATPSILRGNSVAGDQYVFFSYASKSLSYTLEAFAGVYYAKVVINATADCKSSGMYLSHVSGTQASVGIISIQNASYSTQDSPATSVGDWCEARNDVIFAISGSVGITLLKGVISISVSGGANWTQSAILRAWKTDPYGHVIQFAEVYTI